MQPVPLVQPRQAADRIVHEKSLPQQGPCPPQPHPVCPEALLTPNSAFRSTERAMSSFYA